MKQSLKIASPQIVLRKPNSQDGYPVHDLIRRCPPLDPNSVYCNLLQCSHFADTCVVATDAAAEDLRPAELKAQDRKKILGFASAYRLPANPHILFVWQIAVDESARGQQLALRMLIHLLQREECAEVRELHTTITDENQSSWRLFSKLCAVLDAEMNSDLMFDRALHFNGVHDSEVLVTIAPINRQAVVQAVDAFSI